MTPVVVNSLKGLFEATHCSVAPLQRTKVERTVRTKQHLCIAVTLMKMTLFIVALERLNTP